MKIRIKSSDGKRIRLLLPNSLLLSRVTVDMMNKYQDAIHFSAEDLRSIRKALRSFKRKHKNFTFVEVNSKDG